MRNQKEMVFKLFDTTGFDHNILKDPDVAHMVIHHNSLLSSRFVPDLQANVEETEDGVKVQLILNEGATIVKPVHMCFGMLHERGIQKIIMDVNIRRNSGITIYAHCTFPYALDIKHIMDAKIFIGENAQYSYFERHIHGSEGGVKVYPKASVNLERSARFMSEFELLKGRVSFIEINYETVCKDYSVMEMKARINGKGNDIIRIKETGHLIGEGSRGALISRVAVRGSSTAEVYNKLIATAPYARGHVDCKEIIQDQGVACAIPIVEVKHPKAHITHEAAIGSVDLKEMETLMARGLTEDEAVETIIQGLLI